MRNRDVFIVAYVMINELFFIFHNCFLLRSTLNGKTVSLVECIIYKLIGQVVFSLLNACHSGFLLMVM